MKLLVCGLVAAACMNLGCGTCAVGCPGGVSLRVDIAEPLSLVVGSHLRVCRNDVCAEVVVLAFDPWHPESELMYLPHELDVYLDISPSQVFAWIDTRFYSELAEGDTFSLEVRAPDAVSAVRWDWDAMYRELEVCEEKCKQADLTAENARSTDG